MTRIDVRAHRDKDVAPMLDLHARAFGVERRTSAHWSWLEREGVVATIATADDSTCVGMYVGVRRRFWCMGRNHFVSLGMDVAVAPELRHGLASGRLLVRMSDHHRLLSPDCILVYGFPQPPLLRTLVGKAAFSVLDAVEVLARDATHLGSPADGSYRVERGPVADADIDDLWSASRDRLACTIVRDARHWRHRFDDHPTFRYTTVSVRDASGQLRGMAAVRLDGVAEGVGTIMDWLVRGEDVEVERVLLAAVDRLSLESGLRHAIAMFRRGSPPFRRFVDVHGFRALETPYRIAYRRFADIPRQQELEPNWHLTFADMDFF